MRASFIGEADPLPVKRIYVYSGRDCFIIEEVNKELTIKKLKNGNKKRGANRSSTNGKTGGK